jgi:hypothetical protein
MSADLLALARLGQQRGTGSVDALFLDLGSDELLTAYDKKKIFSSTVKEQTIKGGRSMRFIVTGRRAASYHTPGAIIDGTTNNPSDVNSRILYLDGLLQASETIYDLDELREYPSTRAEIMHQLGQALADEREARIARVLFAASGTSVEPLAKAINAGRTGDRITLTTGASGFATKTDQGKGDELHDAIRNMVILKQKKHVPTEGMCVVVTPDVAGFLYASTRVLNADFNGGGGANGSVREGFAGRIYGVPVYWSNFVTQAAYTLQTGDNANSVYAQDLSKCQALIYHRDAMGVLNLRQPKLQMTASGGDYNVMYQSQLLVASMAMGMGVLSPECAGAIVTP